MPHIIEECEIRVSNITFGFNNAELLGMLTERGSLITAGKLDKIPEINEKIDAIIKEKRTEFIRPVAAFITFERQEGKDRAIKYFISQEQREKEDAEEAALRGDGESENSRRARLVAKVDKALLGHEIVVTAAPEPSEILWHNRHITVKQARCHKIIVFFCCLVFLIGMFILFTWMKSKAIKNMFRYPTTMNCDNVQSIFVNSNNETDLGLYNTYAEVDASLTQMRQGAGIYQCYCKNEVDIVEASTNSSNICHTWFRQAYGGYAIG